MPLSKEESEEFLDRVEKVLVEELKNSYYQQRVGIEEVRYQFQRDIEQTSFRDVSLSEPQIFLHGNISYVICNLIFIGETIEGEDFAMKGRYSAMLDKNDG